MFKFLIGVLVVVLIILVGISVLIPVISTIFEFSIKNIIAIFILCIHICLAAFFSYLLPWVSILSMWIALFIVLKFFELYGNIFAGIDIEIIIGNVYEYFRNREKFVIDLSFGDDRTPQNLEYTNKKYLFFFFYYFIGKYMKNWGDIRNSALIYHRYVSISFITFVFWHFTLLQYVPKSEYLNVVYLIFVLVRRLMCLCGHMGALIMFSPLKYHEYEVNLVFAKAQNHFLPKILPLAFAGLLVFFFIFLSCLGVKACLATLQNGVFCL